MVFSKVVDEYRFELKDEDRENFFYEHIIIFQNIVNKNSNYKYTYEQVIEWVKKFSNLDQVNALKAGFSVERALKFEEGQDASKMSEPLILKYNAREDDLSFEDLSLLNSVCSTYSGCGFAFKMLDASENITVPQVVSMMNKVVKSMGGDGIHYGLKTVLEQSNVETAELFADHVKCLHEVIPSADSAFIENLKATCIGNNSDFSADL